MSSGLFWFTLVSPVSPVSPALARRPRRRCTLSQDMMRELIMRASEAREVYFWVFIGFVNGMSGGRQPAGQKTSGWLADFGPGCPG